MIRQSRCAPHIIVQSRLDVSLLTTTIQLVLCHAPWHTATTRLDISHLWRWLVVLLVQSPEVLVSKKINSQYQRLDTIYLMHVPTVLSCVLQRLLVGSEAIPWHLLTKDFYNKNEVVVDSDSIQLPFVMLCRLTANQQWTPVTMIAAWTGSLSKKRCSRDFCKVKTRIGNSSKPLCSLTSKAQERLRTFALSL